MWNLSRPSFIMNHDEVVTLQRPPRTAAEGGAWVDGKFQSDPGLGLQYSVRCSVQPVSERALMLLPEGQRETQQFHLYCPKQQTMPANGDTFERDGEIFEVQETLTWGNFIRARAVNCQALATLPEFAE